MGILCRRRSDRDPGQISHLRQHLVLCLFHADSKGHHDHNGTAANDHAGDGEGSPAFSAVQIPDTHLHDIKK